MEVGDRVLFTAHDSNGKWYRGKFGGDAPGGTFLVKGESNRVYSVPKEMVVPDPFKAVEVTEPKKIGRPTGGEVETPFTAFVTVSMVLFLAALLGFLWLDSLDSTVRKNESDVRALLQNAVMKERPE